MPACGLVLRWNPTPGTSRLLPTSILIALFVAGVEALRRLTIEQFPGAERRHLWEALAGLLPARRGPPANGIPTEEELAAEKSRILSG
jgi:hypothetical protein